MVRLVLSVDTTEMAKRDALAIERELAPVLITRLLLDNHAVLVA